MVVTRIASYGADTFHVKHISGAQTGVHVLTRLNSVRKMFLVVCSAEAAATALLYLLWGTDTLGTSVRLAEPNTVLAHEHNMIAYDLVRLLEGVTSGM